jgi:hypothetical protein
MAQKNILLGDGNARQAAKEFLLAAFEGRRQFKERYKEIMNGDLPVIFGPGGDGIASTPRLQHAEASLAAICVKLLTKKIASESDILASAWARFDEFAERAGEECSAEFADSLLRQLQTDAAAEPVHFMPNYAVSLTENVRSLDLGVVEVCTTQDILPKLKQDDWRISPNENGIRFRIPHRQVSKMLAGESADSFPSRRVIAPEGMLDLVLQEPGSGSSQKIAGAVLELEFPKFCWRVNVNALHGAVAEEALWLVNITMSLVRLFYPRRDGAVPLGGFSARENHPTLKIEPQQASITLGTAETSPKGSHSGLQYVIGDAAKEHFVKIGLKSIAEAIYNASPKTVAERLGQGLGWLSRGRQAESRSERFLYFFTSLEALLSSDDKGTPIGQTISRHAAVILFNDAHQRALLAKELQKLYGLRSSLVHAGKRNVSAAEAARSQELLESLYLAVLQKVKVTDKFEIFSGRLAEASYGLPWLPDEN